MKRKAKEGGGDPPRDAESPPTTFEAAFQAVEAAAEKLERGDLPLEDSLLEYERGVSSLQRCYELLRSAQKRIEVLGGEIGAVVEEGGSVRWAPAGSLPALRETLESVERQDELPP